MTHNENIKNYDNVLRHLELEAECLEAAKLKNSANVTEFGSRMV